ncbi:DUF924 family protein [Vibrio sp. VB16]|uniref:DUF924 family protein n=1 Tax=Vibrio sp. VB16 TaxID=2785746 RepID=UPI00189F106A|nr:DUF924 family protein [Vibrio sp. VB16]UGA56913.1 DUF924 domain-containing protein [Vibrio sp. VB16]
MKTEQNSQSIIDFWFKECTPEMWFKKDLEFDQIIQNRFMALHQQASQCNLFEWRKTAEGRLAEIIVLDQFPRNIFRDTPLAFATDALALALAQEAVIGGYDQQLDLAERTFLYMPYMHSESQCIHEEALRLFKALGQTGNLDFEIKHKVIIDRFGRYPHRNDILGRVSTEEERAFLKEPNSGF